MTLCVQGLKYRLLDHIVGFVNIFILDSGKGYSATMTLTLICFTYIVTKLLAPATS